MQQALLNVGSTSRGQNISPFNINLAILPTALFHSHPMPNTTLMKHTLSHSALCQDSPPSRWPLVALDGIQRRPLLIRLEDAF
jgi:hypothetical protein